MAYVISTSCYKCNGAGVWVRNTVDGEIPVDPCPVCQGSGILPMYSAALDDLEAKVDDLAKNLKALEKTCDKILKIISKESPVVGP